MAISVGSVVVDVIPSAQGIYRRLQQAIVPAATRVGDEAGRVAGRSFGQSMQEAVGDSVAARIGQRLGQQIGQHLSARISSSVRDGVTQGGRTARPAATRQGEETAGAFGRAFRTRLQAAMQSLPRADVRLSDTGINADLARLRARLETLGNKRIGVDVDAATALAEVDRLEGQLRRLGAQHPSPQVRVDTAAAISQLTALRAEIAAVDGSDVDVQVDVDTRPAVASFSALTTAAIAFGPAILPVLPVVAAGLGAVAAAASAAGVGLGGIALVAVPAFKQISGVLQAQKAAQDAAAASTEAGGRTAAQAASRALQLASAEQAVAAAARNGARQIAQAQAQVRQARQAAAQAAEQAAVRSEQAARRVRDAERALADAQKAARQAQLDLTAARKQAAMELEDLNNRLASARLSQRDAEIALAEAAAERDQVLKNAKSTELDRQKAILAYDQAVQRLKEQTLETQRLEKETAAANKAGVEGSKTVQNAQQQLAQAQQQVADRTQALKDAQAEQARTAMQNAQQLAQAQQRIADAQANVAHAQAQAADQAASAQRQLQQAQLSSVSGTNAAALAQAKYRKELAALSPAARETMGAYLRLREAFSSWSESLQPAVMPIFTRALDGIRRALPSLTPFVLEAADAIKGLQDRLSAELKTPFWQELKKDLQGSVRPAIEGLGVAFGNIFKGAAGIIAAFLPHMDDISGGMQRITERFANWGAGLKDNPKFQQFLTYVAENAPLVGQALGTLLGAVLKLGVALSPLAGTGLVFITTIAEGIRAIPTQVLTALGVAFSSVAIGAKLASVAMGAWRIATMAASMATQLLTRQQQALNAAQRANLIGIIVTAIMALVVAAVYAYNRFGWFRTAVQAAWNGIKTAALYVWNVALKPFFEWFGRIVTWLWQNIIKPYIGFIINYWKMVASVAMWLWKNVLTPVFRGIGNIITWWWNNIVKRYFALVRGAISTLGDVFRWLYDKVVKPVWDWISKKISSIYNNGIKPAFNRLKTAISSVGDAFRIARDGIGKAWDKIKDLTKKPINFVIGTVWNEGVVKVWKKIGDWIPGLPKLDKLPKLAQGGTLPVQPGVFNAPTAIVGEGNPRHPEYVIPTDPKYRGRALALWEAAGTQLLAKGGVIGSLVGGLKSLGGKVTGFFSSAASFLKNPGKALDDLMKGLLKPLDDVKKAAWGKLVLALPKAILKGIKELVTFGGGDIGGTIPKGKRLAIINQALAAAGVPPPGTLAQWQAGLNTLITRESGWNPRAINRWDSNAKAGIPSQGLAQTIPPTFNAYVPKSLKSRGILDPVANVAAAIRYIVARYGNITRVQQANANMPPAGYDSGGYLQPGLNLAYNGTGRPEPVLTPAQWQAIHGAAVRGADAQPVVVELHAKEGTLGDFIDVRVRDHQQQLIQVIRAT